MTYGTSNNDNNTLLEQMNEIGINLSKEDVEIIISSITEKYETQRDITTMHPLTRAFINLADFSKKSASAIIGTL